MTDLGVETFKVCEAEFSTIPVVCGLEGGGCDPSIELRITPDDTIGLIAFKGAVSGEAVLVKHDAEPTIKDHFTVEVWFDDGAVQNHLLLPDGRYVHSGASNEEIQEFISMPESPEDKAIREEITGMDPFTLSLHSMIVTEEALGEGDREVEANKSLIPADVAMEIVLLAKRLVKRALDEA